MLSGKGVVARWRALRVRCGLRLGLSLPLRRARRPRRAADRRGTLRRDGSSRPTGALRCSRLLGIGHLLLHYNIFRSEGHAQVFSIRRFAACAQQSGQSPRLGIYELLSDALSLRGTLILSEAVETARKPSFCEICQQKFTNYFKIFERKLLTFGKKWVLYTC